MTRIAVTGGLASGKSTVCHFFKECGAYVISADEIVHQLLSPDTDVGQRVINLIGSQIIVNQQIDRSQIAKKVFQQPELLKALEDILHPAVHDEMQNQMKLAQKQDASTFVAEIPLLFEIGWEQDFDYTIFVKADCSTCKKRYRSEDYEKRMARQWKDHQKEKKAHFIIENNGSLEQIKEAVFSLYAYLNKEE